MEAIRVADALAKIAPSVARIAEARGRDELVDCIQDAVESIGFDYFGYTAAIPRAGGEAFFPLMTTLPTEAWEAFHAAGLFRSNPMLDRLRSTGQGGVFPDEAARAHPANPGFMALLEKAGLAGGAVTPIISPTEELSVLGGYARETVPRPSVLPALAVIGSAVSLRLITSSEAPDSVAASLSPIQWDILHWMKQEKSNLDTATILGISKRKCDYHVAEIYRKLGVVSRIQAITAGERLLTASRP